MNQKQHTLSITSAAIFSLTSFLANDLLYREGFSDDLLDNPIYLFAILIFIGIMIFFAIREKSVGILIESSGIIAASKGITFLFILADLYDPPTKGGGFLWGLGFALSPIVEAIFWGIILLIGVIILIIRILRKRARKTRGAYTV